MNELNCALLKDLIESTNFKKFESVRNPINIIWMLEQSTGIDTTCKRYLNQLKLKENQFNHKSSRRTPSFICYALNNENIFLKRFDDLVTKIGDITPYFPAIINMNSINILKHSIDCGLNINQEANQTYPLKYALDHKIHAISNYLYQLPEIDKLKVDVNGNNLAHLAALGKIYKIISQLSEEHISLFYVKNLDNKTAIDIIFNYKQYDTLPDKTQNLVKNVVLKFIDLHHSKHKILSNETFDIIKNSQSLKTIFIESNYHKMNQSLVNMSNSIVKKHNIIKV